MFYNDNRVVFNSVETYDNTISNLSDPNTLKSIEQINKNSLKSLKKSDKQDDLYDDFLPTILNEDKIVQIGKWIIKVDIQNEKVFVLSEENEKFYNDLKENINNKNIYVFSTEDDVLDLLEEGVEGTIKDGQLKRWGCSAVGRRNKWKRYGHLLNGTEIQVIYHRAGIYYSLFAAAQNLGATNYSEAAYVKMNINYMYEPCRRGETKGTKTVNRRKITDKYRYRVYSSGRRLEYLDLTTTFYLDFYHPHGGYNCSETATLKITG